jgi:hypothetical protein
VTRLRAERLEHSAGAGNFSLRHRVQPGLVPTQPLIQWVSVAISPGIKRPGREADHSPPSSAEVKNACSYTSTPPYVFMAWYFVKHRDSFTFTFTFVVFACKMYDKQARDTQWYRTPSVGTALNYILRERSSSVTNRIIQQNVFNISINTLITPQFTSMRRERQRRKK